jgi:hypothetical protein
MSGAPKSRKMRFSRCPPNFPHNSHFLSIPEPVADKTKRPRRDDIRCIGNGTRSPKMSTSDAKCARHAFIKFKRRRSLPFNRNTKQEQNQRFLCSIVNSFGKLRNFDGKYLPRGQ